MGSQEANERIPEAGHLEPARYVGGGDGGVGQACSSSKPALPQGAWAGWITWRRNLFLNVTLDIVHIVMCFGYFHILDFSTMVS